MSMCFKSDLNKNRSYKIFSTDGTANANYLENCLALLLKMHFFLKIYENFIHKLECGWLCL